MPPKGTTLTADHLNYLIWRYVTYLWLHLQCTIGVEHTDM